MGRVLIIDSDVVNRNRIAYLLEERGIESDQATGRTEAIDLLDSHEYTLVMIELDAADHQELAFLDELRRKYPKKISHTVLLTAAEPKFFARVRDHAWCAILVKPFSAAELYRTVDFCIDDRDSTRMGYH